MVEPEVLSSLPVLNAESKSQGRLLSTCPHHVPNLGLLRSGAIFCLFLLSDQLCLGLDTPPLVTFHILYLPSSTFLKNHPFPISPVRITSALLFSSLAHPTPFQLKSGMRQRCSLSPLLGSFHVEKLVSLENVSAFHPVRLSSVLLPYYKILTTFFSWF